MKRLPVVSSYGGYINSNYGVHTLRVSFDGLSLYYSYNTIVAFRNNHGLVCCENNWGNTTGKHLNMIQSDHKVRLPIDKFEKQLDNALKRYGRMEKFIERLGIDLEFFDDEDV